MKLKHLQERVEDVEGFEEPQILLEQYVTPPHLSSHMLYTIQVRICFGQPITI